MAVFDITLFSSTLHRQTQLTAILPVDEMTPPGFPKPDRSKPFRLLILLHGFYGSHQDWLRGTRIESLANRHNIAVFCPSGENSFYLDDTIRDVLYEQFVCRELVDFASSVFPVSRERKDVSVGGLSMGGYGALHCGMKHGDVFGNVIALSSALITDSVAEIVASGENPVAPPSYYLHVFGKPEEIAVSDVNPKVLAKKLAGSGGPIPNIFMACGTEDFLNVRNRDLDRYLTEVGIPHVYHESPGIHDWAFWDEHIEKALCWLDANR